MKPTRRSFLRFLGALAPGLALARAGMGATLPTLPGPHLIGLNAWLPRFGYDETYMFGTYRTLALLHCSSPGYNGVIHLGDDE